MIAATYPAHTSGMKRPQTCGGACSWPGAGREPLPKNSADHARLNTPSGAAALAAGVVAGSGPARLGKSDCPRSFQVMIGIVASTRGSAAGEQQRQRPAVRGAGDAHPRVAGPVLADLGPGGEPVDELAGVGDLVLRGVQGDLSGALAEPARRPGEGDVAALRPGAGLLGHRVLAAAEAVRHEHRGRRAGGGRQPERGVEALRLVARRAVEDVDAQVLAAHRAAGRGGGGHRRGPDEQDGEEDSEGPERAADHVRTLSRLV